MQIQERAWENINREINPRQIRGKSMDLVGPIYAFKKSRNVSEAGAYFYDETIKVENRVVI